MSDSASIIDQTKQTSQGLQVNVVGNVVINLGTILEPAIFPYDGQPDILNEISRDNLSASKSLRWRTLGITDGDKLQGRDGDIQDIIGNLEDLEKGYNWPVIPIVGARGVGKSSLVQAGLLGYLSGYYSNDNIELRGRSTHRYFCAIMRPTSRPLRTLSRVLCWPHDDWKRMVALYQGMENNEDTLSHYVDYLIEVGHEPAVTSIILIIDQFEELFQPDVDPGERKDLLQNIFYATSRNRTKFKFVFTLRAEAYAACSDYPMLRQELCDQLYIGHYGERIFYP